MFGIANKIQALFRTLARRQRGISTIQALIGGVAMVASTATIAGGIITSGAEASEATEEEIIDTIETIAGTFMMKGSVIAMADTTGSSGKVSQITFTVALVLQDGAVDFTPPTASSANDGTAGEDSENIITISYTDENQHYENIYWTLTRLGRDDGDNILEANELFQITIGGDIKPGVNGGNLVDLLETELTTYSDFTIEIGAAQGAILTFDRTTPSSLTKCNNLR